MPPDAPLQRREADAASREGFRVDWGASMVAQLAESSPDMMFVIGREGEVMFVNAAAARAFRAEPAEIQGRSLLDLFPPEVARRQLDRVAGVLETGDPARALAEFTLAAGEPVWLDTALAPLLDDSGVPFAVMGVSRDVSDHIHLQAELADTTRALEAEKAFTDAVLDGIPAIFYVLDFRGRFRRWNRRFEEVTGLSGAEVAETNAMDLFEGEDRARVAEGIRRVAEEGSAEVEARMRVGTGGTRHHVFTGRRLMREEGGLLVGVGLDLEERKRQEAALKERVKELRCLTNVSRALQTAASEQELVADVARAVPEGFQFPDKACARVIVDGQAVTSPGFRETSKRLAAPLTDGGAHFGSVEVFCTRDDIGDEPFLAEEKDLVRTVAQMLGQGIARRRIQARYVDLYENAPDMLVSVDPENGRVLQCNDTLLEATGFTRSEVEGHPIFELYHPDSLPEAQRVFQQFLERGDIQHGDLRIRRKSGPPLDVSLKVKAVRDAEGRILHSRSSWRDITAQKALERELAASRGRLLDLMERLPVPIANVEADGRIDYLNPMFETVFGYGHGDIPTLDDWWRLAYPDPAYRQDVIRRWSAVVAEAARSGAPIATDEYQVTCKDGSVRSMQISGAARDGALLASFADHTELRRVQEEIRGSAERYRSLFEAVPVSLWSEDWSDVVRLMDSLDESDPDEIRRYLGEHPDFVSECLAAVQILDVNQETLSMFHATAKEQMLASLATVFDTPDTVPGFIEELVALGSGQERLRTEMRLNTVDGERIETLLTMTFPQEGAPGHVLVSLLDITRRKRAEEKLRQHSEDLEELIRERTSDLEASNRELEAFAYSVSHDLRAPLRAISGFSKALLEDYDAVLDEVGRGYLNRCVEGARRMSELIDELLALSRVSRADLQRAPVSLTEAAREAVGEADEGLLSRHRRFDIEEGLQAVADPTLLGVVMQNLIENAVKFSGKVEAPVIVVGRANDLEGRPFFVRDNGAGFDMAHVEQLFVPFQRLHKQEEFPGSGIGLSIVQRIVHRHGGQVWAEGRLGQGATFYFTLPDRRP